MNTRREEARINAIYLQQQIHDFRDHDRPIPKWTKHDREALSNVLREYRYLDRFYRLAVDKLQEHNFRPDMAENWMPDEFDESWFVEAQTGSTDQSGGLFSNIRSTIRKLTG